MHWYGKEASELPAEEITTPTKMAVLQQMTWNHCTNTRPKPKPTDRKEDARGCTPREEMLEGCTKDMHHRHPTTPCVCFGIHAVRRRTSYLPHSIGSLVRLLGKQVQVERNQTHPRSLPVPVCVGTNKNVGWRERGCAVLPSRLLLLDHASRKDAPKDLAHTKYCTGPSRPKVVIHRLGGAKELRRGEQKLCEA